MSNPFEGIGEERDVLDERRAVVSKWGEDGRLWPADGSVFVESLSVRGESLSPFQEELSALGASRSVLREDDPQVAIGPLAFRKDPPVV
jgi:hypothetical protein